MKAVKKQGVSKSKKKLLLACDCGCGAQFRRYKNKVRAKNYLNAQHCGAAQQNRCSEFQCGPYLDLFKEYLTCAERMGRNLKVVRSSVRPFFLYMQQDGVLSLQSVDSATVTQFCSWGLKSGYRAAATDTSALSTFFQWAIVQGYYEGQSPVVPALHAKRKKPRVGRPYSVEEMSTIRLLLEERGNPRLRAFFEIAAESGMRAGEVSRLRLQDVCFGKREIFVGLPNKTKAERTAYFHDRAEQRIQEWLEVRRDDAEHDLLFHNSLGQPLQYNSVAREFGRTLCIGYDGVVRHETRLQAFGLHRLRHTLASKLASNSAGASTVMKALGWISPTSINGYVKIDEESKKQNFVNATNNIEADSVLSQRQVVSQDEFLLSMGT